MIDYKLIICNIYIILFLEANFLYMKFIVHGMIGRGSFG